MLIDHGRVIYDGALEALRDRYGTHRTLVVTLRALPPRSLCRVRSWSRTRARSSGCASTGPRLSAEALIRQRHGASTTVKRLSIIEEPELEHDHPPHLLEGYHEGTWERRVTARRPGRFRLPYIGSPR